MSEDELKKAAPGQLPDNEQSTQAKRAQRTAQLLQAQGIQNVVVKPIIDYGSKIFNDQLVVKKVVSETEFVVYHQELRCFMAIK